ncbi:thioredoxin [Candidatus Uhrbacteria bacterium]|nr:thioredoxin [Candidatus Uhrbacteria bacterium]
MEIVLTEKNFDQEVIKSNEIVLVDFWAPWCGPCRMLGPVIEELAKEWSGKGVKIGKVNVDEEPALARDYGIMSIPTLIFFKNGKSVNQTVGAQAKEKIEAELKKLVA